MANNAINSLNFDNNTYIFTLPYGTCSTGAKVAAKTVTVANFALETGARIAVKFDVANTASSPTLNVNSTGAKYIYHQGEAISAEYLEANNVYEFIYNGKQWDLMSGIGSADPATTSKAGLMSAADKSKLDDIEVGANAYTHDSYTSHSSGLYKVAVDSTGHVSQATQVIKSDITALGIPAQDTTYNAAGTSLGLVKSGGDVTISDGEITVKDDSHNHTVANISDLTVTATELNYMDGVTSAVQTQLNNKLGKTTYEYNKELALGSTGKICIGKFPMYDSNISVEIKSTTSTTYNGTLIIATQNINTTGGGTYTATVYGDASNSLTDAIKIQYLSGSNVFSVYIDLPPWSKNLLHIQCVALKGEPTDIATAVSEIPSTATIVPTNALKTQLDSKSPSNHTHDVASTSSAGLMAAADKVKLNAITVSRADVKALGAKGDGSTNDTAVFQSALANNRIVFVPGGTYVLSDALIIGENCCLTLSQDTVLQFTQTSGNCIAMLASSTLRGNHAIISCPYAFTGNVIAIMTALEPSDGIVTPYKKVGSHMFKRQRFVYDVNIIKPDASGFCRSDDGTCNGTAIYMCADHAYAVYWMWALSLSGIRIAGGFSYGIRAINYDSPTTESGHYEDDAWNHDMRVEAVIEGCEVGVALENCNGAHLSVTIQPSVAMDETTYAKYGVYLNDAKYIDMTRSRVWDWDAKKTLWTAGGEYQHLAMIGQCRGLLLDDYMYYESGTDIRDLIYTDTPSNLENMTILQEPITRWFKGVDSVPYFNDGIVEKRLMLAENLEEYFTTERICNYTDVLATAIDTDGSIYNGIGYNANGGALSSDGAIIDDTEAWYGHTGFIACQTGDTIYIKNMLIAQGDGWTKAFAYDANFNLLGQNGTAAIIDGTALGAFTGTAEEDGGTLTVVKANTAYVRISFQSVLLGSNPIIAINEEIKFIQEGYLADSVKVKSENIVGLEDDVNALIDAKLGVIENGSY